MYKIISIIVATLFFACFVSYSQESLKSTEEEYYDFLSLEGLVRRPSLNYRTLSDSVWNFTEDGADSQKNVWKAGGENGVNLGKRRIIFAPGEKSASGYLRGVNQDIALKIYGPEWFNSYNTAAPYGQNDGALWQGKGYNTSFSAGARIEAYGFSLTFKPQISFSQNLEFEYIKPNYAGENFKDKAEKYGYYGVPSIDAPQRFGADPFFVFDWGDSEIRYTWRKLTVGFGTQTIWLGPARINPIIHSNNAASYPKIDIGLKKTPVYFPHFGWYLGDFEWRSWWGVTTESEYFDNDSSNNHNLIAGLSLTWAPPFLPGFSIGLNRTMLSKWNKINGYSAFEIYLPFNNGGGEDESDQRFSFTFDYVAEKIGLELYLEWGRNDYSPQIQDIIRYPFHTAGWTGGVRKSVNFKNGWRGEILLEITDLSSSRDYEGLWATTFYAHHIITQGYTNRGQWLGAGAGTGGNSQYLGFKLYIPKGWINIFVQRKNQDLDYTWYYDIKNNPEWGCSIRTTLSFGLQGGYYITQNCLLNGGLVFTRELEPLNNSSISEVRRNNFNIQLGGKYQF